MTDIGPRRNCKSERAIKFCRDLHNIGVQLGIQTLCWNFKRWMTGLRILKTESELYDIKKGIEYSLALKNIR